MLASVVKPLARDLDADVLAGTASFSNAQNRRLDCRSYSLE